MISIELLQAVCPNTKLAILSPFIGPLTEVTEYYDMKTPERLAAFIAQIAHESGSFTAVKENLNYSADGLRKIFGKYFGTAELAAHYARQPIKIANRVYANRMNNGSEESGDGYRFCGRGLIQITGRLNYTKFAQALNMSIEDTVAYMETPAGACASAGWFWDNNGLNDYCDSGDFIGLTKRINGGTNGIEDRQQKYEVAFHMLQQ